MERKLNKTNLFQQKCFINGEWILADNKKNFPVYNPFDNSVLGTVPECGVAETERAIQAAHAGFLVWRAKTAKQRADVMWRWAELIATHKEDLALIMTL